MIKRLIESVREYKKASFKAPIFMVLEVLMEVSIPFLMATLIDEGIAKGNMSHILKIGLILILLALLSMTFGILSAHFAAKAAAGFACNLRHDMYYNVQNFSFYNIDKFSSSSIVTRLTTDVTNVQNAFQMILRMAVRAPIMLTLSLAMCFQINNRLSLIFLAVVPILGVGLFFIAGNVHPIFVRVFDTYDVLNNLVQENLRGIRVVKSYVRESHEEDKFGEISKLIYTDFSKAEKRLAFNMPLMQFCMYGTSLLISWIGAKLIVSGDMSTGQLMSVIGYSMMILMSLMMLSMVFVMIIVSRASAERIVEILDEKSDIINNSDPIYNIEDGSIIFKNVDFSYAKDMDKLCLSGVDFKIESGETVGILGGTGSSKTTLVQLIPRLYDVTSGQVLVGGVDVREYDIETLREEVSVVLQKNVLFSGTIKENLRWGDENASDEELIRVCKLAQADEFIREFPDGYDTYIEQGGTNVSGGQKQRLCIARALLKKPKVLILDDSTSAVDTKTDSQIRRAFKDEIPDTTKIIIAQRIASIQDADKIVVLDGGRIYAIGTHDELLESSEIYKEVWESQTKGGDFDEAI
ncbi:MAG: ABC transporter ATP-binding protein/permease [Clostridioides sp.]|nr:ABC transporter ATP-binding protein/permease [Clostridioides sp.]